jgi:WhiB family redox-sensing transcriptional regulator
VGRTPHPVGPRRPAAIVRSEFDHTLDEARANNWTVNCEEAGGVELFSGYDAPGVKTPTPEEAALMCEGCPALMLCREYAQVIKPAFGVWGGQLWQDGKVVKAEADLRLAG